MEKILQFSCDKCKNQWRSDEYKEKRRERYAEGHHCPKYESENIGSIDLNE